MGKHRESTGNFQDLIIKTDSGNSITKCRKVSNNSRNKNSFSISEMYEPQEETKKRPKK